MRIILIVITLFLFSFTAKAQENDGIEPTVNDVVIKDAKFNNVTNKVTLTVEYPGGCHQPRSDDFDFVVGKQTVNSVPGQGIARLIYKPIDSCNIKITRNLVYDWPRPYIAGESEEVMIYAGFSQKDVCVHCERWDAK